MRRRFPVEVTPECPPSSRRADNQRLAGSRESQQTLRTGQRSRGGSKRHRFAFDPLPRFLTSSAQATCRRDMHLTSEQVFQVALESSLLEQAISVAHIDEYI